MNVLFLSPSWPPEMSGYVRGLRAVGASVVGVGDAPAGALDAATARALTAYVQVPAILDDDDVIARLEAALPRPPDRVEALWEPVMNLAATLRRRWGLPGLDVDTTHGFRDKPTMNAKVQGAGLATPPSGRARTVAEVRTLVDRLGLPVIIKPVAGAGSADTFRVRTAAELEATLPRLAHVPEVAVESYVTGPEYTYETLCLDGRPVYRSVCRYWPNTLEARKKEWISPIIHTFREPPAHVTDGIELGDRVLDVLGMGTGITHMEWFDHDGQAVFGEVACRPPGANMIDLMNYAGDVDLYLEWARAVVHGEVRLPERRPYSAAIVFKRAQGQGRIRHVEGLDAFVAKHGRWVARVDLLPVGARRRDWQATFLADGNLVVRHPDDEVTLRLAREAAATIHLYAS